MREKPLILIVDDDPDILFATARILTGGGYEVLQSQSGLESLTLIRDNRPDLVLLDVNIPDMSGLEVCRSIKSEPELSRTFVAMISGTRTGSDDQSDGLDIGADGYITRPISNRELLSRVRSMIRIKKAEDELQMAHDELEQRVKERTSELEMVNEALIHEIEERTVAEESLRKALTEIDELKNNLEMENIYLRREIEVKHKYADIVGQSEEIMQVLSQVELVSGTDSTVLLIGETGTGKELIAGAIHNLSSRKAKPMVKVNCAALPATLIESELFGREKGAYTGALSRQAGRFEVADGSTIFLDEISELPLELQAKLLRVLERGEFERLGSSRTIRVDVRIIAATNRDISTSVQKGTFREDLYYRLNVFPITVPPLRERTDDIPLLAWEFVKEFERTMGKRVDTIPRKSMEDLQRYPWPGNARELRNVIERAMIVSREKTLQIRMPEIMPAAKETDQSLEVFIRNHILKVLESTEWRVKGTQGAAEILGMKPTTLFSKMIRLGIKRPDVSTKSSPYRTK